MRKWSELDFFFAYQDTNFWKQCIVKLEVNQLYGVLCIQLAWTTLKLAWTSLKVDLD